MQLSIWVELAKAPNTSTDKIQLKKISEDQKEYYNKKLESKKGKNVLSMLKSGKDKAMANFKNKSNEDLIDFYKSEF